MKMLSFRLTNTNSKTHEFNNIVPPRRKSGHKFSSSEHFFRAAGRSSMRRNSAQAEELGAAWPGGEKRHSGRLNQQFVVVLKRGKEEIGVGLSCG
jgi:hypothetical protein